MFVNGSNNPSYMEQQNILEQNMEHQQSTLWYYKKPCSLKHQECPKYT